jgi:hypothetical protein
MACCQAHTHALLGIFHRGLMTTMIARIRLRHSVRKPAERRICASARWPVGCGGAVHNGQFWSRPAQRIGYSRRVRWRGNEDFGEPWRGRLAIFLASPPRLQSWHAEARPTGGRASQRALQASTTARGLPVPGFGARRGLSSRPGVPARLWLGGLALVVGVAVTVAVGGGRLCCAGRAQAECSATVARVGRVPSRGGIRIVVRGRPVAGRGR